MTSLTPRSSYRPQSLEAAAAAPFTFTEEKRIIADFFWHASRKAWRTCRSTTYRVGDIWRDVTLLAPMTCDKVVAQDPRSPPWSTRVADGEREHTRRIHPYCRVT